MSEHPSEASRTPSRPQRPQRPPGTIKVGTIAGSDVLVTSSWFLIAGQDRNIAGERPQHGYAFQAEEVRQRVLVNHGSVDAGIFTGPANDNARDKRVSRRSREVAETGK